MGGFQYNLPHALDCECSQCEPGLASSRAKSEVEKWVNLNQLQEKQIATLTAENAALRAGLESAVNLLKRSILDWSELGMENTAQFYKAQLEMLLATPPDGGKEE